MRKNLGIMLLLVFVIVLTASISDRFLFSGNIENLIRRTSLFGIISIGAAFVIITGGIDLSIGSLVCLTGVLLPYLINSFKLSPAVSLLGLLILSALIGIFHGVLITKIKLQPFIVTLCGLLLYRGFARGITSDQTQGFGTGFDGLRALTTGRIPLPGFMNFTLPAPVILLALIAIVSAIFLNKTVWGRHLMALGFNEQAARYSGVATANLTILAYTICAVLSGLGGMLFVLDVNSAQPADFGNFYELYAIAAAVLGGCSLRGGEGSVLGVVIGTAIMQVLRNSITLLDIPTQLEYAIIGGVLLIGVSADEIVRRLNRGRAC